MAVSSTDRAQARASFEPAINFFLSVDTETLSAQQSDYLLRVGFLLRNMADAFLSSVALRAQETNAHTTDHFLHTAQYVGYIGGIEVGEATRMIEVATALPDMPELSEEFRSGALSFDKVSAVVEGVEASPHDESRLVRVAHCETVKQLKREVRKLKAAAADGSNADNETYFKYRPDGPFHHKVGGRLSNEQMSLLKPALDKAADEVFKQMWKSGSFISGDHCRAAALVALATDGAPAQARPVKPRIIKDDGEYEGRYLRVGIRRQLAELDDVCELEGCDLEDHLENDHNKELRDGGKTSYRNVYKICAPHHRYKTVNRMILEGERGHMTMRPLLPSEMGQPP